MQLSVRRLRICEVPVSMTTRSDQALVREANELRRKGELHMSIEAEPPPECPECVTGSGWYTPRFSPRVEVNCTTCNGDWSKE